VCCRSEIKRKVGISTPDVGIRAQMANDIVNEDHEKVSSRNKRTEKQMIRSWTQ